jgi:hypothetical protein
MRVTMRVTTLGERLIPCIAMLKRRKRRARLAPRGK